MNLKIKLTSLAILLASGSAIAGDMGAACQEGHVTVPCDKQGWAISAQALYMQMTTGAESANSTLTGSTGSVTRGANTPYSWGFQVEGAYDFQNGKDLNLNWYRLRSSNSKNLASPTSIGSTFSTSDPVGISSPSTVTNVKINSLSVSNQTGWDMVNMEHGRLINIDEEFNARIHFGGEYSRVYQDSSFANTGTSGARSTAYSLSSNITAVYNGFGPRLGLDLGYDTAVGLGFYGKAAVGVLAGTAKTHLTQTNTTNINTGLSYSVSRVITTTDGRLGLSYGHDFLQSGALSVDAGWMWVNYLSPLVSQGSTTGAHNNNFGVQGVYFGAKWQAA